MDQKTQDFENALKSIAALQDANGNERLDKTGSYSAFDEPGAVQTAREILEKWGAI